MLYMLALSVFMNVHQRTTWTNIWICTGEEPSDKIIKCNECDYKCNSGKDMERYMLTHKCDIIYICSVCDYQCTSEVDMKHCMTDHREEKAGAGIYEI